MAILNLHLGAICILSFWTVALAEKCNNEQFEKNGICCDVCPPGTYVNESCTEHKRTICSNCLDGTYSEHRNVLGNCQRCLTCEQAEARKCTVTTNANCSCNPGFLCSDDVCSKCEKKKKCQKGEQLERIGFRDYFYSCVPCPNNTYSNTEEGSCKPVLQCNAIGFSVRFPGNKTHNSICYDAHARSNTWHFLAIAFVFFAFAILMFLYQLWKNKITKRRCIATVDPAEIISAAVPEMCIYHLSKEETGDQLIQKAEDNCNTNCCFPPMEQPTD